MNTDQEIRPIAEFLYKYRTSHNLAGDAKQDWKDADYLLTNLKLEDKLIKEHGMAYGE